MGFWMRDAHIHHGLQDALTVSKPNRIKEWKNEKGGRAKKNEANGVSGRNAIIDQLDKCARLLLKYEIITAFPSSKGPPPGVSN